MTQEPPQSWPRRDPGFAADRPLVVDPLTGELISSDPVVDGSGASPAPDAGSAPPADRPTWSPPVPGTASGSTPTRNPVPGRPSAAGPGPAFPGWSQAGPDRPSAGSPDEVPQPGYPQAGYPQPGYPQAAPAGLAYGPGEWGPASYPPPGYGPPPQGWGQARPTNGMAIASLVLGAVWLFWIGTVLALVLGYTARNQIRRTGEGGDGLAVAGIVLGWVGIAFLALGIIGAVADGS